MKKSNFFIFFFIFLSFLQIQIKANINYNLNEKNMENIKLQNKIKHIQNIQKFKKSSNERIVYLQNGPIFFNQNFINENKLGLDNNLKCKFEICSYLIHFLDENININFFKTFPSINVISYIPHNTFLVMGSEKMISSLPSSLCMVTKYEAKYKLSELINLSNYENIFNNNAGIDLKNKNSEIDLIISVHVNSIGQLTKYIEQWKNQINGQIKIHSNRIIVVTCIVSEISSIVSYLSEYSYVTWIEPRTKNFLFNYEATATIQSGRIQNPKRIYHSAGLTGKDQIIAIGDGTLDTNHCFFNDPNHELIHCNQCTHDDAYYGKHGLCQFNDEQCETPSAHRKIIGFWDFTGVSNSLVNAKNTHGTHTSGSIAGKSIINNSLIDYGGQAPDSKIIFTQLGSSTEDDPTSISSIVAPTDLYR
jgi:hypothetical protein